MAAVPGLGMLPTSAVPGLEEILQIKKESEMPPLKLSDPLSVVEMALEVEVERARAMEALSARDAAIQRLSEAYVSIRQKMTAIDRLQQQQTSQVQDSANEQVVALEKIIKTLRQELAVVSAPAKTADLPPSYAENGIDHPNLGHNAQLIRPPSRVPLLRTPRETHPLSRSSPLSAGPEPSATRIVLDDNDLDYQVHKPDRLTGTTPPVIPKPDFSTPPVVHTAPKSSEPEDIIKARHALLAAIPLPADPPDDTLKPIIIPAPFTLHEFLANATGSLRNALSNYRVLQELTTSWCPEREEHGYLLTPLFKCSTNPRVATAHRWNMVDVMARISKPTECFYHKDGNWYYAGVYKAFRLEDLTTKEWDALSNETTQAIVRDTIAGRKNTSPQNVYETSQLYAAGALRVACLGLQCVGFNKAVYRAVLEQAAKCAVAGKWKAGTPPNAGVGAGLGLGAVGGAWNAAGDLADGVAAMSVGGSENVPAVQGGKGKK